MHLESFDGIYNGDFYRATSPNNIYICSKRKPVESWKYQVTPPGVNGILSKIRMLVA